jgi:TnpA family transposase
LSNVSRYFIRESTIKAANAVIVDYHHSLPLTQVWGDGSSSSSDGQRFGVQKSSLLASFYPRYFGHYDRAVTVYTHTSDQHSVFHTDVISCGVREAVYVLDGLLENTTALRPQAHFTDTHGYTEHLFALCHLLGFSFMPRIKDLSDQRLYKLDRKINYGPNTEKLFSGWIDLEVIQEQWDSIVRIIASLKDKTAPAHLIIGKLARALPADRLAKAIMQLGRMVKTIFIFRYLSDESLRQKIQKQLNRGEARHQLAKWLFFANQGQFRSGDYEEMMNKASCLSLLSNAVLVANTAAISKILRTHPETKDILNQSNLMGISPLLFRRVIPNGTYHFK